MKYCAHLDAHDALLLLCHSFAIPKLCTLLFPLRELGGGVPLGTVDDEVGVVVMWWGWLRCGGRVGDKVGWPF